MWIDVPASLVATMPILRFSAMLVARHMRSTSVRSLSGFFCRAICTVDTTPLPSGKVYFTSVSPSDATAGDSYITLPFNASTTTAFTVSGAPLLLQMST